MGLDRIVDAAIRAIEWLITALLILIFGLTVLLVILRYLFNSSILGASEVVSFLFIYTTALGAAVAIPTNRHIRITYLIDHLPRAARTASEVLILICVAGINVVMLLYSLDWIAKVGDDLSQSLEIPLGIVKVSVPIGCGLAALLSVYAAVKTVRDAATDRHMREDTA